MQSTKDIASRIAAAARLVEVQNLLRGVEGWLHPLEGFALMELAAHGEGRGQIVEIGSFKGLSTCWLAFGVRETSREKVAAIDHFRGSAEHQAGGAFEVREIAQGGSTFPVFQANLRRLGLQDVVEPIVASSEEAAATWKGGAVRLLFIDGDHSYEATRRDAELWTRLVCPRGYVAFHDVGRWEGVTRYYNELVRAGRDWREVVSIVSLRVLQRVK